MSDRILERRTLARSKFDVDEIRVRASDGSVRTRHVIRHPGAVVILAIDERGGEKRIVFIRNRRVALGRELLELPAGTLEPGEDPAKAAARELEEETGFALATIEPLGRFYTTPGMTDELMRAYVARGLREVGQRLEADEDITVEWMSVREALKAIEEGRLEDGKSMLAILLAQRKGLLGDAGAGA